MNWRVFRLFSSFIFTKSAVIWFPVLSRYFQFVVKILRICVLGGVKTEPGFDHRQVPQQATSAEQRSDRRVAVQLCHCGSRGPRRHHRVGLVGQCALVCARREEDPDRLEIPRLGRDEEGRLTVPLE